MVYMIAVTSAPRKAVECQWLQLVRWALVHMFLGSLLRDFP